tara:strand:+ start:47919 stop:49061 length:1143 start_codon:yes stop_codon:yes gene_type:complete
MKRRNFLFVLTAGTGLSLIGTKEIIKFKNSIKRKRFFRRRLLIIHLDGGNDGLFSFAPKNEDVLLKNRPKLMKALNQGVFWDNDVIINKNLTEFIELKSKGWLNLLPNVGYENPNTSHFISKHIWETGSRPTKNNHEVGWIGQHLRSKISGNDEIRKISLSFEEGNQLLFQNHDENYGSSFPNYNSKKIWKKELNKQIKNNRTDYLGFEKIFRELNHCNELSNILQDIKPANGYPKSELGNKLSTISSIIKSEKPIDIFHLKHKGYDTHSGQKSRLNFLYADLSKCLNTLAHDLNDMGEWNNTQILVFSEFGRTINENSTGGTDHGTAGPVFVLGGKEIYDDLYSIKPSYETFNIMGNPYLQFQINYQNIYRKLKKNWLV